LHLHLDHVDRLVFQELGIAVDEVIFLSKHRAASGKPTLTMHMSRSTKDGRPWKWADSFHSAASSNLSRRFMLATSGVQATRSRMTCQPVQGILPLRMRWERLKHLRSDYQKYYM